VSDDLANQIKALDASVTATGVAITAEIRALKETIRIASGLLLEEVRVLNDRLDRAAGAGRSRPRAGTGKNP
jgi:hypothetical protein